MSTSLLYHGFGINGYHYVNTKYEKGNIIFTIQQDRFNLRCPECKSKDLILRGKVWRRFKTIPIGLKKIFIDLPVQRIECLACNIIRQVKVKFSRERRTYTKAFERYVLELSKHATISDVADHLGVSWDIIKDIQQRYYSIHFGRPKLTGVEIIAIDEISIGKNHNYLTVVLDLKSGRVLFVAPGKGSDALKPFWKRLKCSKAKIKAVAIDMSPAYISAVLENLPKAAIVFDRFHVVKMMNDKLSELRRKLQSQAEHTIQAHVLKGTRWLLLKNPDNLDTKRNEEKRLEEALKLNQPLATAYYLKEDLRQFWDQPNKKKAKVFLNDWVKRSRCTKIPILIKMANTIAAHKSGLLSYYDYPISTGPLEGTNNKIKTLQKQAYGFRNLEFFKLKIYALHQTKYALVG